MKALIFGVTGQDGFYLNEICRENKIEVVGISRSQDPWTKGYVADKTFVERLIKQYSPDYIFHIAANSTTKHETLFENHATISLGTLNILESVKDHCPSCKVFITGSGVQFVNRGIPIKETDAFEASSPYAVARIHSVYAARYYRSLGIKVYVGYLFHHESPLRKAHHISKITTDFIKRTNKGSDEKLILGDISVRKEWGFARDIAEGIFKLTSQEKIFEATIGTGVLYSIQDWLEECFNLVGKDWKTYIVSQKGNFIPEYTVLSSDPATIFSLGWKPKTSFQELAEIMMR